MQHRRIVLWGAGQWSLKHYKEILENLREDISVVGIADNNYEKLNKQYASVYDMYEISLECENVLSAEDVQYLYAAGKIDSVFLGVYFENYIEVKKQLRSMNIPLFSDFVSCSELKKDCIDKKKWDGISVYVMQNTTVYHDFFCFWRLTSWLCTDEGVLVSEMEDHAGLLGKIPPWFLLQDYETNVTEVEECCVLSGKDCNNYWHFTYEILPKIHLLEKNGYTGMYMIHYRKYAEDILELYGLKDERIIWINDEVKQPIYCIKKMYCTERLNSTECNEKLKNITKLCVEVSDVFLQKVCKDINYKVYPKRIYVKRVGSRKLLANEKMLEKYGFVTIVPEKLTVKEQIRYFYAADIVISPHGANSTNALYMRKGKCFIESFPWNHITPCCNYVLKEKKVNYSMVVERFSGEGTIKISRLNRDYVITDIDLELAILGAINALEVKGEVE